MVRLVEKFTKTQYCDRKQVRPVIVLTHDMICISEKRITWWPCNFLEVCQEKLGYDKLSMSNKTVKITAILIQISASALSLWHSCKNSVLPLVSWFCVRSSGARQIDYHWQSMVPLLIRSAKVPYALNENPLHLSKIGVGCMVSRKWIVGPPFFEQAVTV
jgi:hypothetical protein